MALVPAAVDAVLRDLEVFGRENDAHIADRNRKMLNLERDTAELVHLLVRSGNRRRVLEIGTSNGYSTIWIAAALGEGGILETLDRDGDKLAEARRNLARAGLDGRVRFYHGAGTDIVGALPGPFDCVFFDADRVSAPDQLALLLPRLTRGCLLLADNALSHPDQIAGYVAAVEALPGVSTTILPVGKGLHVTCCP